MSLTVTVLGSSGTYAGPGGACSGFLVRSDTTTVMMDAGPGTLANLQRHADIGSLDAVLLSHSHPDHWLELPVMRNALKYILGTGGLDVYLTAETLELADELCSHDLTPTFRPHVITDGSEFKVGDLEIRCSRTDHPVETLAFRVSDGERALGYSSDTGPGWSLGELGDDLDLALCEATFVEGSTHSSPVHLSAAQAGATARRAGVRRLALTHVLPTGSPDEAAAEAAETYGAPVDLATVDRTFTL